MALLNNNMKRALICCILLSILLVSGISGCSTAGIAAPKYTCDAFNQTCAELLAGNSKTCTDSEFLQTSDYYDLKTVITKGAKDCRISYVMEKSALKGLEGSDMVCTIPLEVLSSNASSEQGFDAMKYCEGSLKETIGDIMKMISSKLENIKNLSS